MTVHVDGSGRARAHVPGKRRRFVAAFGLALACGIAPAPHGPNMSSSVTVGCGQMPTRPNASSTATSTTASPASKLPRIVNV